MLKRFTVKNYKSFKNSICIDFEKIAGYQFNKIYLWQSISLIW